MGTEIACSRFNSILGRIWIYTNGIMSSSQHHQCYAHTHQTVISEWLPQSGLNTAITLILLETATHGTNYYHFIDTVACFK